MARQGFSALSGRGTMVQSVCVVKNSKCAKALSWPGRRSQTTVFALMKTKTPQEKKRLSLAKDRRNVYGETNKGSRRAIPLNKALEIRSERRRQNKGLTDVTRASGADDLAAMESVVRGVSPRRWRKSADAPLREVLQLKIQRRRARVAARLAQRREMAGRK